ncbi:MAG: thioredoxin family protein [Anaerolineae bacterium]|nr:thioredoxin family protein [Anaerolineae bacterium]
MVYLDLLSDVGREAARAYDVQSVPTLLVFDGAGNVVLRQSGLPDADAVKDAITALDTAP